MSVLLINGGTVYTADAQESVHARGAVLIVDDKIAAVGSAAEVAKAVAALDPARKAELSTIDAGRMMVLPGFVNAHWHEMFAMRFPMRGALRPVSDRDDQAAFMGAGGDMHQISAVFDSFDGLIDGLTPDEAQAIAEYSMWTQLRGGVTTLGDMGSLNRPHSMVAAAQRLGIRFSASTWASDAVCPPGQDRFVRTTDADTVLATFDSLLQLVGKDTTGRIRCRPSIAYVTNMTDELARGMAELAAAHDLGFATHVGALRNEVELMRTYYGETGVRRLAELGLVDERLMAGHCAFLDEQEQKLMLAARAHISHSPGKYGPSGESSLTETGVVPALRRAGLDVSLSTDGSSMPTAGIAETMRAAWQMYNEMGADQTEVLPSDALAMATRIAAKGLRWDDAVGSLEVGKQADLVLIPADDWRYLLNPRPLEAFLWLSGSADVDTVIVGGRRLLSGGKGVEVHEAGLRERYLTALGAFTTRTLKVPAEVVGRVLGQVAR
ncbi:amidohydrolase family protein [Streptomyces sp. ISL-1]|uniref:amidohydrolase family protein n=1 Tax=Streptomyces sp. ISL-1 TaxID=2817657 RepID=UPI001BEAD758|nr:amidohydrolase family protein [Streptomyces sp. ISL-1]MBT2391578.1 amidohydrolase family protein [Streptomyces sp. ISL-1]